MVATPWAGPADLADSADRGLIGLIGDSSLEREMERRDWAAGEAEGSRLGVEK